MNSVSEQVLRQLQAVTSVATGHELRRQLISLMDLTSLGDTDTPGKIAALCQKAVNPLGQVAAVCVYPAFVSVARQSLLSQTINIATVANFPAGGDTVDEVVASIQQSLRAGANEIDVVFPYERYLAGDQQGAEMFLRACRQACGGGVTLKVILETGAIDDLQTIAAMSETALLAGADFLKTSTGKIETGATLPAAAAMLLTIKTFQSNSPRLLGFKAAGGVRQIEQAAQYIALAEHIMGKGWVRPATFRLGASQLLDTLLQTV